MTVHLAARDCRYALSVDFLGNPDFKAGLEEYLSRHGCTAIILGTRRYAGDPRGWGGRGGMLGAHMKLVCNDCPLSQVQSMFCHTMSRF